MKKYVANGVIDIEDLEKEDFQGRFQMTIIELEPLSSNVSPWKNTQFHLDGLN